MKKRLGKLLAVTLAMLMLVSIIPLAAFADSEPPIVEEPVVEEPVIEETVIEETVIEETVIEETVIEETIEEVVEETTEEIVETNDEEEEKTTYAVNVYSSVDAAKAKGTGNVFFAKGDLADEEPDDFYLAGDMAAVEANIIDELDLAEDVVAPTITWRYLSSDKQWRQDQMNDVPANGVFTATAAVTYYVFPIVGDYDASGDDDSESDPLDDVEDVFTVDFMVEGVDGVYATFQVAKGDKVTKAYVMPNDFPARASAFAYWYADDENVPFDFDTAIEDDLVLNAKFEYIYNVEYADAKGEIFATYNVPQGVNVPGVTQDQINKYLAPSGGKHFAYWYEKGDESDPPTPFNGIGAPTDRDLTLYPYFNDECYVFFVSEGTQVDYQVITAGGTIDTSGGKTATARIGYTFVGWTENKDADPVALFDFDTAVNDNLTLYAVWTPTEVDYKIVYWREKANIKGDAGTDPKNYEYYQTKSDKAYSGTATADIIAGLSASDLGSVSKPRIML